MNMADKMESPLISIVVPIYNGEKYLQDLWGCLRSQTYRNFEVLFIDDFSTDASYSVLEGFVKEDSRFYLYRPKAKCGNGVKGQEFALPLCKGSYYFYMSQDDWMEDNLFELCVRQAENMDAEVVIPNMFFYYGPEEKERCGIYPAGNQYHQELAPRSAFLLSLSWEISGFAFRSMELVKRIGIRAEYYNSCEYFIRKSYLFSNKIVFANANFYYRQDNSNALTKVFRYFYVDMVSTELLLTKLLLSHSFKRRTVRKHLWICTLYFLSWIKKYFILSFPDYEKKYIKKSLVRNWRMLISLWGAYLFRNKNLMIADKGE